MPAAPHRRSVVVLAFVVVVAFQFVALYAPDAPGPESSIPHGDKAVHALVFALPVLVAGWGRREWWPLVAALSAVHAPVSEFIQHLTLAHRSGDPWDVVADWAGVAIASMAVSLVVRRLRRRR